LGQSTIRDMHSDSDQVKLSDGNGRGHLAFIMCSVRGSSAPNSSFPDFPSRWESRRWCHTSAEIPQSIGFPVVIASKDQAADSARKLPAVTLSYTAISLLYCGASSRLV
jgi:hypothetical protein